MKNKLFRKILVGTTSVVLFLAIVLAIHIYIVTRPRPTDPNTKEMARIDIKQPITQDDANAITAWLYQQKGIDHVLVNPQSDIAVFTFYPVKTSARQIVSDFKTNFNYKSDQFIPSQKDLAGSCPVMGSSVTYKVYKFFQQIF